MDRLAGIVRCQWRAYWRRFSRARNLTVGHQGITLIITVLILFKYLRLLGSASVDLARGNTTLVQSLLAGIFLAWLFLPIGISRAGISLRGLLHLPLSVKDLFAIRIASLLITPYSWMVAAGSLAICYPLAHAPRPWAAMTAALLFIAMSCSIGLAIAHLLSIAVWRRLLFAVLILLCAAAAYVLSGKDAARFVHFPGSCRPTWWLAPRWEEFNAGDGRAPAAQRSYACCGLVVVSAEFGKCAQGWVTEKNRLYPFRLTGSGGRFSC